MIIFLLGLVGLLCAIGALVFHQRGKELPSYILMGVVIFLGVVGIISFWIS